MVRLSLTTRGSAYKAVRAVHFKGGMKPWRGLKLLGFEEGCTRVAGGRLHLAKDNQPAESTAANGSGVRDESPDGRATSASESGASCPRHPACARFLAPTPRSISDAADRCSRFPNARTCRRGSRRHEASIQRVGRAAAIHKRGKGLARAGLAGRGVRNGAESRSHRPKRLPLSKMVSRFEQNWEWRNGKLYRKVKEARPSWVLRDGKLRRVTTSQPQVLNRRRLLIEAHPEQMHAQMWAIEGRGRLLTSQRLGGRRGKWAGLSWTPHVQLNKAPSKPQARVQEAHSAPACCFVPPPPRARTPMRPTGGIGRASPSQKPLSLVYI